MKFGMIAHFDPFKPSDGQKFDVLPISVNKDV